MTDDSPPSNGSGQGLLIAVLSLCALLTAAAIVVLGMIVYRYLNAAMQDRPRSDDTKQRNALMVAKSAGMTDRSRAARTAVPLGNPGEWFSSDDYPSEALRTEAEGRVSVKLLVGRDGRVSGCIIAKSSGSTALDEATCRLATHNGQFRPATDPAGRPIASTYPLPGVKWQLGR